MEQLSEAVEVLTAVAEPIPAEMGGIAVRAALNAVVHAAWFGLEAAPKIYTLTAELAACQAMCQRLATEAGQGGLTAAELKALAGAAEVVAIQLCDPRDPTGGLLKVVAKAKATALRMDSDDSE
jgi:hypothetical protein